MRTTLTPPPAAAAGSPSSSAPAVSCHQKNGGLSIMGKHPAVSSTAGFCRKGGDGKLHVSLSRDTRSPRFWQLIREREKRERERELSFTRGTWLLYPSAALRMPCPCGSAQPTRARRLCAARVSAQAPRRASLCSQSTSTSTRRLRALQSLVTGPPRRNYALCRSDCSPGSKPRLWGLRHRQGRSCRANEGRPERHPWAAPRLWSLKQFIHHLFALGSLVAPHIVA